MELWARGTIGNDTHVIPINDLIEHDETGECLCQPFILPEGDDFLIIHNAWDGRQ